MFKPAGGDDYVFLAALEIEITTRVALAQVAGVKPAVRVEDRRYARIFPVAGRDIFAAHQNLFRFGELYFEAWQRFPDGAFT